MIVFKSCRVLFYLGLTSLIGFSTYHFLSSRVPFFKVFKGYKKLAESTFVDQKEWIDLKLSKIIDYNYNCKIFRFDLPSKNHVSGLQVASALLTKFNDPSTGPVIRAYTPITTEDTEGYLDLLIKKYNDGPMSSHIHNMKVDETLLFKGPIVKYPWSQNMHKQIALIAGGTGITPMYQLIRKIFDNPQDKTHVTLVFANIMERDILLREEFDALEKKYPDRFQVIYVLDHPPENWKGASGRVNKNLLESVLPNPSENIKIFVCGPSGFYQAVSGNKISGTDQGELSGILKELGYTKEQVFKF